MAVRRTVPADPLHKRFTPNSHRICEMSSGRPPTMVQDDRATARARGMDRAVPRVPGSPGGTLRRPVLVPPQCPSGSPVARTADQACRSYSPRARPSGARRAVRPGATGRRLVTSGSTRRHERMWTGRRCGGGLPWAGGPARGASGSGPLAPPAGQPLTGRGEQVPRLAPRRHSSRTSRPWPAASRPSTRTSASSCCSASSWTAWRSTRPPADRALAGRSRKSLVSARRTPSPN